MAGSTVGRMVVDVQTNKSGGAVAYGDVVINDATTAHSFTTTTSGAFTTGVVGVCIEPNGIASNATGRVQTQGYVAQVNTNASVTLGYFLKTHTVAKQAAGSASRVVGAFGVAMSTGTNPAAMLWGLPDATSASDSVAADSIWDVAGDLAVGTGADTAARLAKGTALQTLRVNSGATALQWADTLGAWTDYTPTWTADGTAPAIGNGSLTGRYKALDSKTYIVEVHWISGTTTTYGTLQWHFALPAGLTANKDWVCAGVILGGSWKPCNGLILSGGTTIEVLVSEGGDLRAGTPWAWASGYRLYVSGLLEVS